MMKEERKNAAAYVFSRTSALKRTLGKIIIVDKFHLAPRCFSHVRIAPRFITLCTPRDFSNFKNFIIFFNFKGPTLPKISIITIKFDNVVI